MFHLTGITHLHSTEEETTTMNCKTPQSQNSASLTRNDWFLNGDIIDPYPGCKWKPPRHRSRQPAPVLLGRWEGACGQMKTICLDGATSSGCCDWCKQLHFSRYDKPWTVITCKTPTETGSLHEAELGRLLTDLCLWNLFGDVTACIVSALVALR